MDGPEIILKSAGNNIGYVSKKEPKKPWVNVEMIKKMDERRKWRNNRTDEGKKRYLELNNELRRSTEQAKEDWWNKQCEDLEELDKKGRSDLMYTKVKEITINSKSTVTQSKTKMEIYYSSQKRYKIDGKSIQKCYMTRKENQSWKTWN